MSTKLCKVYDSLPSGDLAHRQEWLGDRSDRGPQLKDLVSQQPGFGFKRALISNHAAVSKSEAAVPNRLLQLRALSQELAQQSRGTGAQVDHKVDPSPPRVLVGDSSPTGGLPLALSAFSAFLLFSLFRSLRCFFAFLAAVTFASDGGSSLVRAFGSGNSSCGSSSHNALRACLERGAAAFSSFSSFSAKAKTFSFLPAPGWSKRRAQVS